MFLIGGKDPIWCGWLFRSFLGGPASPAEPGVQITDATVWDDAGSWSDATVWVA